MTKTLRVAVAVLAMASAFAVAPRPAEAARVYADECVETSTWSFSPPLTLTGTTTPGSATNVWSAPCVWEEVTTAPSETAATLTAGSTRPFSYIGSCALAVLSGATVHILLGGTLLIEVGVSANDQFAKVEVLVPGPGQNPCNLSSATGTAVRIHSTIS